jgi:hypothetical protein
MRWMRPNWNEPPLHAYAQLAQAIARHLYAAAQRNDTRNRGGRPELCDAPSPLYYHCHMSTFERACDDLCRLRIMRDACANTGLRGTYYVFACDVADADTVAMNNCTQGPSFDELFSTFLSLFGDFGSDYWGLSTQRNVPFGAGGRLVPALDALAALGYLTNTSVGYVWTERATAAMHSAGYWQEPAGKARRAD